MAIIPGLTRLCSLGRGSTATVSLASDPITGSLIAIKSADLLLSSPLQHENVILSGLNSPHIISCYGSYTSNSHYHLLLEFAPGGSLFDRIKSHPKGRLDEPHIRSYAREILLGLSYLHLNNISHGDIKTQNILIDSDGHAKIADFGAAVLKRGTHNGEYTSWSGTPAFMAPEVARGEERGPAVDIWALGCTIIEMATGKAPWIGAMDQDVMAAIYRIGYCSDFVPEIPNWLSEDGQDFLMNCLKRDPNERWSAKQLLQHPFVCFCDTTLKGDGNLDRVISPQSALDFGDAFCESETEEEEVDLALDPFTRIQELASSISISESINSNRDLYGEDCWIEVRSGNGGGNSYSEISYEVTLFGYEESSDLILHNFSNVFERINMEMRVRCGNVSSEFDLSRLEA
ncbi:hypothetical protein LUZ61_008389 [Rhynchospora tenuis]|uniref:Protein kinase domain-containing protein n=1 Tax=Rhynchospora tenuis TaxID=198213 RepID=A0AAD5ZVF7_9POAL|nr:hypothetical protein LUZ61_008389 [Rhynchospora tenuis]